MTHKPSTVTGRELYELLPIVYRVRDERGDLARYLDACGSLLDRMRATIEQRLADSFVTPDAGMKAQSWILPYFADLLDVRVVSAHVAGKRHEIHEAISWRQRKGTVPTIEEIAEKVGGLEAEVQEGWRRVAITPRPDRPILPAAAYGEPVEPDRRNPLVARRHPGLPAVTVDVTEPSRAIRSDPAHPRAKVSRFLGKAVSWRQFHPQGVPCFPGSYEDFARRTPDIRTPGPSQGHIDPRRLLLFFPPTTGFFPFEVAEVKWDDRLTHVTDEGNAPRVIVNATEGTVFITTSPTLPGQQIEIRDLVFTHKVGVLSPGRIRLQNVAIRRLVVDTGGDFTVPVVDAVDCLFDEIKAPHGLVRLETSTVMKKLTCRRLQASDCILPGDTAVLAQNGDPKSCVRWSRVPSGFSIPFEPPKPRGNNTTARPIFQAFEHCAREGGSRRVDRFGDPGYGVLHPSTPDAIRFGAEDGGEMGADHHRATSLSYAAILTKLEEFLPLGIEAVLVPDPRLLVEPPGVKP